MAAAAPVTEAQYHPLHVQDNPPAPPAASWFTCQRLRIVAGIACFAGATACAIYAMKSKFVDFHPSRYARLGANIGFWGGGFAGLSLIVPTNITSRLHAVSVISRRTIGTLVSGTGAFLVDAKGQSTGDYQEASAWAAPTFFAGLLIAFGPEAYRLIANSCCPRRAG